MFSRRTARSPSRDRLEAVEWMVPVYYDLEMPKEAPCKVVKAVNSSIRRKVRAALTDIQKGRPKRGGIKLHEVAFEVSRNAKKVWAQKKVLYIGNDAFWVGSQLMKPSTMHWPKWKDRVQSLLANVDAEIKRTSARCQ